ncbi:MAG: hypothetical protein M5U34_01195 [Chloroflexi bacterium]|nr:hypothetical protein [Chloroflexota bacterium]
MNTIIRKPGHHSPTTRLSDYSTIQLSDYSTTYGCNAVTASAAASAGDFDCEMTSNTAFSNAFITGLASAKGMG